MNIVEKDINELVMYENNPRKNDEAVKYVANSIEEFGFKVPIIVDKDNVIVAGHTRLKAAKKLKIDKVPCIVADDLTDEQIKAFRLADNKVAEFAVWDDILLNIELADINSVDMEDFGFDIGGVDDSVDETYTSKTDVPQYEVRGIKPDITMLYDDSKAKSLMDEIEAADAPDDVKRFLLIAASRHIVFNFSAIAEYYAQAPKNVQELMERQALVIIDYDNAIKNGYTKLKEEIDLMCEDEDE